MKYKVGDKVKVRNDLVVDEQYGDGVWFGYNSFKICDFVRWKLSGNEWGVIYDR